MPGMWWHHVEASSNVNLLINYWWRDSAMHLGSPQMALLHAALAIGQLKTSVRPGVSCLSVWCSTGRIPTGRICRNLRAGSLVE
ncbi:unnamed protein product [Ectocarpus sp. 12 AP-2014]